MVSQTLAELLPTMVGSRSGGAKSAVVGRHFVCADISRVVRTDPVFLACGTAWREPHKFLQDDLKITATSLGAFLSPKPPSCKSQSSASGQAVRACRGITEFPTGRNPSLGGRRRPLCRLGGGNSIGCTTVQLYNLSGQALKNPQANERGEELCVCRRMKTLYSSFRQFFTSHHSRRAIKAQRSGGRPRGAREQVNGRPDRFLIGIRAQWGIRTRQYSDTPLGRNRYRRYPSRRKIIHSP
ncbi:hypothetical protein Bbelb_039180 [Branchiostoma belcheri]|nr:hypothetical protein Bbelb_039180 [Branchiostoma belcheri]